MKISELVSALADVEVTIRGRTAKMRALSAWQTFRLFQQWPEPPTHFRSTSGGRGEPDPDHAAKSTEREIGLRTAIVGLSLGLMADGPSPYWNESAEGAEAKAWLRSYVEQLQRAFTIEELGGLYRDWYTPLADGASTREAARKN